MRRYFKPSLLFGALITAQISHAADFKVRDITVEGLTRLTPSAIYTILPFSVGDNVSDEQISQAIKVLYASGHFEDVKLLRSNDSVIVQVVERPVIAKVNFSGNKLLSNDILKNRFKAEGLVEGKVLKPALLKNMEQELENAYAQQGRYDADVVITTVPVGNNRVDVNIKFNEGSPARVVDINVIGNSVFSDQEIRNAFALKSSNWRSIVSRNDQYAKERLAASLEALRALYLNKGYINFAVNSAQLNISEDKRKIFVEVSVNEGQQYRFGQVKFLGNPQVDNSRLESLLNFKAGDVYDQGKVTTLRAKLVDMYGNEGYYFAEVNPSPDVDGGERTVDLSIFINPGKKVFVRRISFVGNEKTKDNVLRREMRQLEGALASNEKIDLSRIRLERTGYFKSVTTDVQKVPNTSDLVDVIYRVEEQPSGTSTLAVGYSPTGGVTFQASLNQINFLGTGNRVNIDASRSQVIDSIGFGYLNPYYTIDGVSRGFNMFYRKTKYDRLSVNNYVTDSFGGAFTLGYPISETQNINMSIGGDNTKVKGGPDLGMIAADYLLAHDGTQTGTGTSATFEGTFPSYNINLTWLQSTLNRPIFATKGMRNLLTLEVALPGSKVDYQKITYDGQVFVPLVKDFMLRGYTRLGYGHDLPFYRNYYAGGFSTVRGFRINSLGSRSARYSISADDSCKGRELACDYTPERMGGNAVGTFGAELIMPLPTKWEWARQIRPTVFFDGGQAFDTQNSSSSYYQVDNKLRYSTGVGLTWMTIIGPLSLSYAFPLNKQPWDKVEHFQFEIGRLF